MESLGRLPRLRRARPPRGRSSLLEWSSVLELGYRSRSPTEKEASYKKRWFKLCVSYKDEMVSPEKSKLRTNMIFGLLWFIDGCEQSRKKYVLMYLRPQLTV